MQLSFTMEIETTNKSKESLKKFRGIITPISWDENEHSREWSLYMDNGEELVLMPILNKLNLAHLSGKHVEVIGHIGIDEQLHYLEVRQATNAPNSYTTNPYPTFIEQYSVMLPNRFRLLA